MSKKDSKKEVVYKTWPKITMTIASIIGIVGTFLPWLTAKFGSYGASISGWDTSLSPLGLVFSIIFAVIGCLSLAAALTKKRALFKTTNVISILTFFVGAFWIVSLIMVHVAGTNMFAGYKDHYGIGIGLILNAIAFITNFIFSVYSPKEK